MYGLHLLDSLIVNGMNEEIRFACFASVLCCDFPSHIYFESVLESVHGSNCSDEHMYTH